MKFVLLSDLQLLVQNPVCRLDDAKVAQRTKLEQVIRFAVSNDMPVLQAGDFTDKDRSWLLLGEWTPFFRYWCDRGLDIYAVFGQHDTNYYHEATRNATALGAWISAGLVGLLDSKPMVFGESKEFGGNVVVYGASYGQEVPVVDDKYLDYYSILVIHEMIVPHKLWPDQQGAIYAPMFLAEHKDYDLILCGDCHRRFLFLSRDGRVICNTGCIIRDTADKFNFEHKPIFYVVDTDTGVVKPHGILHLAADVVLSRNHIEKQEHRKIQLDEFINAVKAGKGQGASRFKDNLNAVVKEKNPNKEVRKIIAEVLNE